MEEKLQGKIDEFKGQVIVLNNEIQQARQQNESSASQSHQASQMLQRELSLTKQQKLKVEEEMASLQSNHQNIVLENTKKTKEIEILSSDLKEKTDILDKQEVLVQELREKEKMFRDVVTVQERKVLEFEGKLKDSQEEIDGLKSEKL